MLFARPIIIVLELVVGGDSKGRCGYLRCFLYVFPNNPSLHMFCVVCYPSHILIYIYAGVCFLPSDTTQCPRDR